MVRNTPVLQRFENDFIVRSVDLSYEKALRLYEAMWNEAVSFGIFPPREPLEGIEVDIRIARILNSCLKSS